MPKFTYKGELSLAVSVKDIEKSAAWYADTLGFKMLYHVKEIGWAEMSTHLKDVQLGLGQNETGGGKGNTTPVWGVADIDAARAELEKKGVKFDGPTNTIPGMVKLATFYDIDGNAFMLHQSLMQH